MKSIMNKPTNPIINRGQSYTIGVTASMFTALVVTRLIFDWLLEKNLIKSLNMLHIIRGANFDFMRWAAPAFIASWALILIGNAYGLHRGKYVLGPDFVGGDRLTLAYLESEQVGVPILRLGRTVAGNVGRRRLLGEVLHEPLRP